MLSTTVILILTISHYYLLVQARIPMAFTKHVTHDQRDFILDYFIGDNVSFAYAVCDQETSQPKKTCVLALDTLSGVRGQTFCTIKLAVKGKNKVVAREYALMQTYKDDILFLWKVNNTKRQSRYNPDFYVKESLKARLVNMSTCDYEEVSFSVETRNRPPSQDKRIKSVNVMAYNDGSFDIVYRNKAVCGGERKCKLPFNAEERKFIRPYESILPVDTLATLSTEVFSLTSSNSLLSAYVLHAKTSLQSGTIKLFDLYGNLLYEHNYSYSIFDNPEPVANLALSITHNHLGICQQYVRGDQLECSQFDAESGMATIGVAVSLRWTNVALTRMMNTENGGFVVLIVYENEIQRLDVLRVDREGRLWETHKLKNEKCSLSNSEVRVELFERTGFQYCYYVACRKETEDEYELQIDSKCFETNREVNEVGDEDDEEEEEEEEW